MAEHERHRMVFEAPEDIKRAIRSRAGSDGVSPAAVINAALELYLVDELKVVRAKIAASGSNASAKGKK